MAIYLISGLILSSQLYSANALTCFCLGHCPDSPNNPSKNGTCETPPNGQCFKAVEQVWDSDLNKLVDEDSFGCIGEEGGEFQCKGHLVPHEVPTTIQCCSDKNLCNLNLSPKYVINPTLDEPYQQEEEGFSIQFEFMVLLCSLCAIFIIAIAVIVFFFLYYEKKVQTHRKEIARDPESAIRLYQGNIHDLIEESSGSGSGVPRIVQQTICKQIDMGNPPRQIGGGKSGDVWEGTFRSNDKIAVKSFNVKYERSWNRETEIYSTPLRNDNILLFIAADIKGYENNAQRLLITEYHQYGSLYHFFRRSFNTRPIIDLNTMLNMTLSIASGLSFLHTTISGSRKPMIAHRDLKTKNILVKDDLTCCIADFGLALSEDDNIEEEVEKNNRETTIQYMAPEVLELYQRKRKALNDIQSYTRADIYSFGLVLWELCMATHMDVASHKDLHERTMYLTQPYENEINQEHSLYPKQQEREIMERLVLEKEIRPAIPAQWDLPNSPFENMANLMQECWKTKPESRRTALNVKKLIRKILNPKIIEETGSSQKYAGIQSNGSTIPMSQRVQIS